MLFPWGFRGLFDVLTVSLHYLEPKVAFCGTVFFSGGL